MSLIRTVSPDRAHGPLADLYQEIGGARGGVASLYQLQSLNVAALSTHFDLYKTLLFGRSELDRRTREMIGVVVAAATGCTYCIAHHREPLRRFGVDDEFLDALAEGRIPADALTPALAALLEYARQLTLEPATRAESVDQLRELGWTDEAILDATMVASYFNFTCRIALGLGAELEDGYESTCEPELSEGA